MPTRYALKGIGPPFPKQQEIVDYLFRPSEHVKQVDVMCGLGFGKTTLCIDIACRLLSQESETNILFLEPDTKRMALVFWVQWKKIVPPELYNIKTLEGSSHKYVEWINGSCLYPAIRNITGSQTDVADSFRGIEFTHVLDDEAAIKFNHDQYKNTFNRIRGISDIRFYLTVTTPKAGPYGRLIKSEGHVVFGGHTSDNVYLMARHPTYVDDMAKNMSRDEVRRELYGELIALEGRIFKEALVSLDDIDHRWPKGNVHYSQRTFRENKPYWLFCDLGSATGATVGVQRMEIPPEWGGYGFVAFADFCPQSDANASRMLQKWDEEYGAPASVVVGGDVETKDSVRGETAANIVSQIWGPIPIYPCAERFTNKVLQYDRLTYLIRSSKKHRRFAIAKDFVSLDPDSKRGVIECLEEYEMRPVDKRPSHEYLPKGSDQPLCHIADAMMMGSVMIMARPKNLKTDELAS